VARPTSNYIDTRHMALATLESPATQKHLLKRVLVGVFSILLSDALWLGLLSKHLGVYAGAVDKDWLHSTARNITGLILYSLVSASIASLVQTQTVKNAAIVGGLLGFLVFSVFNVTTLAIKRNWTPIMALIDTTYGIISWSIMLTLQHMYGK
jgi:uncharacterized membrane protein